ncbi:MAG: HigA family addiction module antidote protein [Lachnospiraceae bacterium]|nr:HigA family addiction module antidote protein [Lachnospiraceae bacterium]
MAKEKNLVGLSRDYIIHPGETLAEVIEDREMTQRELAVRTGMTEKHISTVIHGQKNISAAFAKKLEYALGIEAFFWMNLQANYDRELLAFEEVNNITEEELGILKNLKEVIDVWISFGWLDRESNAPAMVLDLRRIFGISNLLDTPKISYAAAYRAQSKNVNVDPYVLFAWQRMCELLTKNVEIADRVDVEKLQMTIPDIKCVMFVRASQIQKKLSDIFAGCGIAFRIVPNFTGAPVQGFIKKTEDGGLILCMTLRQKFADIFWFTLFHEIAHILNGDTKREFIDFDSVSGDMEAKADRMAGDFLIDAKEYKAFVASEGYKRLSGIERFADSQNVKDYIVQGRLMKEGIVPWKARPKYEWA